MQFKCRFVILCHASFDFTKITSFSVSNCPHKLFGNQITFWRKSIQLLIFKIVYKRTVWATTRTKQSCTNKTIPTTPPAQFPKLSLNYNSSERYLVHCCHYSLSLSDIWINFHIDFKPTIFTLQLLPMVMNH